MEIVARKLADGQAAEGRNPVACRPCDAPEATPRKGRSRATNDPYFVPRAAAAVNPRVQARRRRDLVAIFIDAIRSRDGLGGLSAVSELMLIAVRKAAELTCAAEMARASLLNGEPTDVELLIKLEGEARRAMRALGLKADAKPAAPLRERLAAEATAPVERVEDGVSG